MIKVKTGSPKEVAGGRLVFNVYMEILNPDGSPIMSQLIMSFSIKDGLIINPFTRYYARVFWNYKCSTEAARAIWEDVLTSDWYKQYAYKYPLDPVFETACGRLMMSEENFAQAMGKQTEFLIDVFDERPTAD